jgi:hypothetical protein
MPKYVKKAAEGGSYRFPGKHWSNVLYVCTNVRQCAPPPKKTVRFLKQTVFERFATWMCAAPVNSQVSSLPCTAPTVFFACFFLLLALKSRPPCCLYGSTCRTTVKCRINFFLKNHSAVRRKSFSCILKNTGVSHSAASISIKFVFWVGKWVDNNEIVSPNKTNNDNKLAKNTN